MPGYPDDFSAAASGCFPTIQELRAEGRERQAHRHRKAVDRCDEAMEALVELVGALACPTEAEWYDVDHAETLAAEIEALAAKQHPAIGGVL